MRKKTEKELKQAALTKTTRTVIRLKHSLAADEEINAVLPDTLDEFEAAYANGDLKKLTNDTVASVLADAAGD
jgi:hypothetical protein